MKQISISIPGTTTNTTPDNKPAICAFGEENTGKTRFGCTAPHEEGMIGWVALDKNSKASVDEFKRLNKLNHILVNDKPMMSHKDSISVALVDDPNKTKATYMGVVKSVMELTMRFAEHPQIESIVIDNCSQFYDWILFSHFGRRNQIESFMRGAPNQDMIDFINALSGKNLVLLHRSAEVWKDTGEVDKQGKKKQAPSGKLKPEGYAKIGGFVTATIELVAARKKGITLDDKYKVRVVTCKGNTLLEGEDLSEYGVCGEGVTWDNVMTAIGCA